MAKYPVYDCDGTPLGEHAWKDIPKLFGDNWYLEKGTFHLKAPFGNEPVTLTDTKTGARHTFSRQEFQEMFGFTYSPEVRTVQDVIRIQSERHKGEMAAKAIEHLIEGAGDANREEESERMREKDKSSEGLVRVEDGTGHLLGFYPPRASNIGGPSVERADGVRVISKRMYGAERRNSLLRRSLQDPEITEQQREMVLAEMDANGIVIRALTRKGHLLGFYTEGELRRRWGITSLGLENAIIGDLISEEERIRILLEQLNGSSIIDKGQRAEITSSLKESEEGRQALSSVLVQAPARQEQSTASAGRSLAQNKDESDDPTKALPRKTVEICDAEGNRLGFARRTAIERRIKVWSPTFCRVDERKLVVNAHIDHKPHTTKELLVALDRANLKYIVNARSEHSAEVGQPSTESAKAGRSDADRLSVRDRMIEEEALNKRERMLDKYLAGRSESCRDYVLRHMLPRESEAVWGMIEPELKRHPELYRDFQSYERVRLRAIALANLFDRANSDDIEDLLERAHLFYFDDEAWWEARSCDDPLSHLPFEVCLVEDVLFWEAGGAIKERPLSEGGDAVASRRMLSFVVNRCTSRQESNGVIAYRTPLTALPGIIRASSVHGHSQSPTRQTHQGSTRRGRSPRVHSRRGHWRNQAYGQGLKLRKRIWISDTIVTPSGKSYRVTEPTRIHMVTLR